MIYRRIYDHALAQASYLVGCSDTGEAILFDPERDIDRYQLEAEQAGVRIVAVAETHHHADFVSGMSAFAASQPVQLLLSGMGAPATWTKHGPFHSGASVRFLHDHDEFAIGSLRFRVRHTPGHTREALSFEFIGESGCALALFSGDFLFAGDIGRPDLGFLAAGGMTVEESAEAMRRSLGLLDDMPDATVVLPGHGTGSACGKVICRLPETTVGIERVINRPLRSKDDGPGFVEGLLRDQPDAPPYFGRVKKANESGPRLHATVPAPPQLGPVEFAAAARNLRHVVIDTREWSAWMDGHFPGSIFAMLDVFFGPTVANYLDDSDEVLLVAEPDEIDEAVRVLFRVGIDQFAGWITPRDFEFIDEEEFVEAGCEEINPCEAKRRIASGAWGVIDVRSKQEFARGHISGAAHIPFIQLAVRAKELNQSNPVVVYCGAGNRSARACAYLCRCGFTVANLRGGYWPYAGRGF